MMDSFAKAKAQLTVGLKPQKHLIETSSFQGDTQQSFAFKMELANF
jgi:hypothetical protein